MKFSYAMLPDYPLQESLASIRLADELGIYACYAADETWHKDMWLLFAAAAGQTRRIRFGPSVAPVTLREPSLIAQAVATLDELSDGPKPCSPAATSGCQRSTASTGPEVKPVIDAIGAGDLARGIELTTPSLAERLSVSGIPEECAEKLRGEIAGAGVNHMTCALTDRTLVRAFTGRDLEGVADVNTQLRLIHDRIMPAFA
jgi:alkanesulfonate monooxygenase SsuD/methylene tetrahydromethanopterin reductase-like flavin-dependent oxidoreductase (luciferase family)